MNKNLAKKVAIVSALFTIMALAFVCVPPGMALNNAYTYTIPLTATVQLKSDHTSDSQIISDWQNVMLSESENIFANEMLAYGFYYQFISCDTSVTVKKEPYWVQNSLLNGAWEADIAATTIVTYVSNAQVPDGYIVPPPSTTSAQTGGTKISLLIDEMTRANTKVQLQIPEDPGEEEAISTLSDLKAFFIEKAASVASFAAIVIELALLIIIAVTVWSVSKVVIQLASAFNPNNPESPATIVIYAIIFIGVAVVAMFVLGLGGKKKRR